MKGNRKRKKRFGMVLLLMLALLTAVPLSASAASKVRLSRTSVTVVKGKSCTLKLTGTKAKVSWSSSKPSVASVSSGGKVTGKARGTATIKAKAGGKSYKCTVTVKQPVTSVKLSRSKVSMVLGASTRLYAAVAPENANKRSVTWTSSDPSVVTVSKGKLKAVAVGSASVTVKAADGSGKHASCAVTVTPAMSISQKSLSLRVGQSKALSVSDTAKAAIVWGSSDTTVATAYGGTVVGVSAGKAVITAQKADGSQSVSCKVTVSSSAAEATEPSAAAQQFLSILERYSQEVRSGRAAGKLWGYSNSSKLNTLTWAAAQERLEEKGICYTNCALLVRHAMREMGILGERQNFWGTTDGGIHFGSGVAATVQAHCEIISVYKTPNELLAEGKLLPGDICCWGASYNHTNVYAGNGLWYDAGRGGDGSYLKKTDVANDYGISSGSLVSDGGDGTSTNLYVFRSFGPCASMNMNGSVIGQIIRIVE